MAMIRTFTQIKTGEYRRLQSRALTHDLDFKMITLATMRKKNSRGSRTQSGETSCCSNPPRNGDSVVHNGSSEVVRNVMDRF